MTCVKITFINKIASTYLQKKIPAKLNKYLLLQTPPALSSKLTFSKLDRIFTCVFPNMTIPLSNIGKNKFVRASIKGKAHIYFLSFQI